MDHVTAELGVSQRLACRVLDQHRSTQRKAPCRPDDEAALTRAIVDLATQYGRYGYRRITALLHAEGWACNHKRVERIWRAEGLKVPARQPKRGRLWLADGSCLRLRPQHSNHVWAYDLVEDRTRDGRKFRTLNVVDEFSRECLAIRVARRPGSTEVIDVLTDLFISRGTPAFIPTTGRSSWPRRSGHGSPSLAPDRRTSSRAARGRTAPWRASTARLRDELLECEAFNALAEARVLTGRWHAHTNTVRPHSAPGYRPPASEIVLSRTPMPAGSPGPAGSAAAPGITLD